MQESEAMMNINRGGWTAAIAAIATLGLATVTPAMAGQRTGSDRDRNSDSTSRTHSSYSSKRYSRGALMHGSSTWTRTRYHRRYGRRGHEHTSLHASGGSISFGHNSRMHTGHSGSTRYRNGVTSHFGGSTAHSGASSSTGGTGRQHTGTQGGQRRNQNGTGGQ
ncbi:MAG TPA: hypothetical protein VKT77_12525 [Chthonomonadaceae bacterium]|nr:hypothetical protein [Chthonomonadaceae bacterium]